MLISPLKHWVTNALSGTAQRSLQPLVATFIAKYQIFAAIDLIHRLLFGEILHCGNQLLNLAAVVPQKVVFCDLGRRGVGEGFDADDEKSACPGCTSFEQRSQMSDRDCDSQFVPIRSRCLFLLLPATTWKLKRFAEYLLPILLLFFSQQLER